MRRQTKDLKSASPSLSSSVGGTFYLVLTQFASRALTFVANQFLLRYLSPSVLGLAAQLELLSVTVLYFARESLRVALLRQPVSDAVGQSTPDGPAEYRRAKSQEAINLAYVTLVVGVGSSLGFGYAYWRNSSYEVLESADFWLAFQLYAVATLVELTSEPLFIIIQQRSLYKARARAETVAATSRCLAACLATLTMHWVKMPASVLPFAVGQIFYATTLASLYLAAVAPVAEANKFSLMVKPVHDKPTPALSSEYWFGYFSKSSLSLTTAFYAQSTFKLLLTQGDSWILSFLTNLRSQGAFALASNYGGLLSRLIFQPVEESSRNIFGRLLASHKESRNERRNTHSQPFNLDSAFASLKEQHSSDVSSNNTAMAAKKNRNIGIALNHLSTTLHIYVLFSLPLTSIIPTLLPTMTMIILPRQWRTPETSSLLQAYLYYLPFLATNGVLDAFVTSVATASQLRSQSLVMAGITATYGVFAWGLMANSLSAAKVRLLIGGIATQEPSGQPFGSTGLVYANIFNMALRIMYSVWFISYWVKTSNNTDGTDGRGTAKQLWRQSIPSIGCILSALVVAAGLKIASLNAIHTGKQALTIGPIVLPGLSKELLGCVVVGTSVLLLSIYTNERHFLIEIALPLIPERFSAKIQPYLPRQPKTDQKQKADDDDAAAAAIADGEEDEEKEQVNIETTTTHRDPQVKAVRHRRTFSDGRPRPPRRVYSTADTSDDEGRPPLKRISHRRPR